MLTSMVLMVLLSLVCWCVLCNPEQNGDVLVRVCTKDTGKSGVSGAILSLVLVRAG
jgi:hypothetical protein